MRWYWCITIGLLCGTLSHFALAWVDPPHKIVLEWQDQTNSCRATDGRILCE